VRIAVFQASQTMALAAVGSNLITFVFGELHFPLPQAANVVTNFVGTVFILSPLGGFLSDSYAGCLRTLLAFAAVELAVRMLCVRRQDTLSLYSLAAAAAVAVLLPILCSITLMDWTTSRRHGWTSEPTARASCFSFPPAPLFLTQLAFRVRGKGDELKHANMVGSWTWMHGPEKPPITTTKHDQSLDSFLFFFFLKHARTHTHTKKSLRQQRRELAAAHMLASSSTLLFQSLLELDCQTQTRAFLGVWIHQHSAPTKSPVFLFFFYIKSNFFLKKTERESTEP
jgi:hypothetical protein